MRSPSIRHVVRLRVSILGVSRPLWREFVVDRDASLALLHEVIRISMGWRAADYHLFCEEDPGIDHDDAYGDAPRSSWLGFNGPHRRWGDRWAMIEHRDPGIVDDASVSVGRVFGESPRVFYRFGTDRPWWFRIDAYEDDVVPATLPRVRIVDGAGHAPLPDCSGPEEHGAMLDVLGDPDHEESAVLATWLDRMVGPWGVFDPDDCESSAAQKGIDAWLASHENKPRSRASQHGFLIDAPDDGWHGWRRSSLLEALVRELPYAHRAGLREHVDEQGLLMPVVVTHDDAAESLAGLMWLLGREGIALEDGEPSVEVLEEGARVLGEDVEGMRQLVAAGKRMGLLYSRGGMLLQPRRVQEVRDDPLAVWWLLARGLADRHIPATSKTDKALLLLAIADGSIAGPMGVARINAARRAVRSAYDSWPWPAGGAAGASRPHRAMAEGYDEVPRPWASHSRSEWRSTRMPLPRPSDEELVGFDPLVRLLSTMGLGRDETGRLVVSPGVREFARAALTIES